MGYRGWREMLSTQVHLMQSAENVEHVTSLSNSRKPYFVPAHSQIRSPVTLSDLLKETWTARNAVRFILDTARYTWLGSCARSHHFFFRFEVRIMAGLLQVMDVDEYGTKRS